MDALCDMLADKLGVAVDVSGEFVAKAVPQYTQMMLIESTFWLVVLSIFMAAFVVLFVFSVRKLRTADYLDDELYIFAACLSAVLSVVLFFIMCVFLQDVICWYVTPDAMILKELVNAVR